MHSVCRCDEEEIKKVQINSSLNVKRAVIYPTNDLMNEGSQNPYRIMDLQEIKTTWHPIENIGGGGGGY